MRLGQNDSRGKQLKKQKKTMKRKQPYPNPLCSTTVSAAFSTLWLPPFCWIFLDKYGINLEQY